MSFARRALAFGLWLLFVLVLAEGAVRLAGVVLRRDQTIAQLRNEVAEHCVAIGRDVGEQFFHQLIVKIRELFEQMEAFLFDEGSGAGVAGAPVAGGKGGPARK